MDVYCYMFDSDKPHKYSYCWLGPNGFETQLSNEIPESFLRSYYDKFMKDNLVTVVYVNKHGEEINNTIH